MTRFRAVDIKNGVLEVGDIIFEYTDEGIAREDKTIIAIKRSIHAGVEVVYFGENAGFMIAQFEDLRHWKKKIPIEQIPFDLELFRTGKYDVEIREGNRVEIFVPEFAIRMGNIYPVHVTTPNEGYFFCSANGKYSIGSDSELDLFLVEKEAK